MAKLLRNDIQIPQRLLCSDDNTDAYSNKNFWFEERNYFLDIKIASDANAVFIHGPRFYTRSSTRGRCGSAGDEFS